MVLVFSWGTQAERCLGSLGRPPRAETLAQAPPGPSGQSEKQQMDEFLHNWMESRLFPLCF